MCSFIREKNTKICYVQYRLRAVSLFLHIYWGECLQSRACTFASLARFSRRADARILRAVLCWHQICHSHEMALWPSYFICSHISRHCLFINFLFCFLLFFVFFSQKSFLVACSLFMRSTAAYNVCIEFARLAENDKIILCKSVKWWGGLVAEIIFSVFLSLIVTKIN